MWCVFVCECFALFFFSISITPTPFDNLHTQLVNQSKTAHGRQNEQLGKALCVREPDKSMTSPRDRGRIIWYKLFLWLFCKANGICHRRNVWYRRRKKQLRCTTHITDVNYNLNYVFNFANHPFNFTSTSIYLNRIRVSIHILHGCNNVHVCVCVCGFPPFDAFIRSHIYMI